MAKPERSFRFLPLERVKTADEWMAMQERFLAGDPEAYEFVFMEVWHMSLRFVARAYRGRTCSMYHDIMDMAGDAMLGAMEGILYWEPGKKACLRTWAYAAAKVWAWRVRNWRWKKRKRAAISLYTEDASGRKIWQLTAAPESKCEAEERERVKFVNDAIDSLPPSWATVIRRYYGFEGPEVSLAEQGREAGVSGRAMSHKLVGAIERLSERLAEAGFTHETI